MLEKDENDFIFYHDLLKGAFISHDMLVNYILINAANKM